MPKHDCNENPLTSQWECSARSEELVAWFQSISQRYVIALSGGVDSAVVAKAAALAKSSQDSIEVVLATGDSPSLARQELQDATKIAELVGIEHTVIATYETLQSNYQRNDSRRCYYCKSHLFETLEQRFPDSTIITGTNADDLGDYRPGLQAAAEHQVRAPLAELGFGKAAVRDLAKLWGLPIAGKAASPCLASRIAYGLEVTHERLTMIEQAEAFLRSCELKEFRVRLHPGGLARIEVPLSELGQIAAEPLRRELVTRLKAIGFVYVALDLSGFESGSLNQLIQIAAKR